MKTWKRLLTAFLAVAMLVSMCSMLSSCGEDEGEAGMLDPNDAAIAGGNTYVVNVRTAGGMAMTGVAAYVYTDSSLKELKEFKETDDKGKIIFTLEEGGDYAVTLSGVPKGYNVQASYTFKNNICFLS